MTNATLDEATEMGVTKLGEKVDLSPEKYCAAKLKVWDSGGTVWSVEMGGLGPGYEQAIQILAFELLRRWQEMRPMICSDPEFRKARDEVVRVVNEWPEIGFSGAQVGAATNLASCFYKHGAAALEDKAVKDRKIQGSRTFPHAPEVTE